MSQPSLTDLKRSLLVQLVEYNRLEATLISADQINTMGDAEVERIADLLLEFSHDLLELQDRIETVAALGPEGGDT